MKDYWEGRYSEESRIWGDEPSASTAMALERFNRAGVRTLLVPGAGYGRNAAVFSRAGYAVTGIEISEQACRLARESIPDVVMIRGSVIEAAPREARYDAIYCFNLLHLFRAGDRDLIIEGWRAMLDGPGLVFCVVHCEHDPGYGRGARVEPGTFESKPGRPVHYFTDEDLRRHFGGFDILETGIIHEGENHGEEGAHTHVLRYLFARKGAVA